MLPNLEIVAVGEISAADQLVLDAYAERTSARVWTMTAGAVLAALSAGRTLDELRRFLDSRTQPGLPTTVTSLLADMDRRASQLSDLGLARIIECADPAVADPAVADPAVAALIARERTAR